MHFRFTLHRAIQNCVQVVNKAILLLNLCTCENLILPCHDPDKQLRYVCVIWFTVIKTLWGAKVTLGLFSIDVRDLITHTYVWNIERSYAVIQHWNNNPPDKTKSDVDVSALSTGPVNLILSCWSDSDVPKCSTRIKGCPHSNPNLHAPHLWSHCIHTHSKELFGEPLLLLQTSQISHIHIRCHQSHKTTSACNSSFPSDAKNPREGH